MLLFSLLLQDGDGIVANPRGKSEAVLNQKISDLEAQVQAKEKALSDNAKLLSESKLQVNELQQKLKAHELFQASYSNIPPINITGLAGVGETIGNSWFVQWKLYSSPSCGHCQPYKRDIKAYLKDFKVSSDASLRPHILIVELTASQWEQSGLRLPHLELYVNDAKVYECDGDQITFAEIGNKWNDEYNKCKAAASNLMGLKVGTLEAKPQVEQLLKSLQPFLDGGSLTISYKPKAGVVKDYLTINQGSVALRIPANTAITFAMNNMVLSGTFAQPSPQVRIPIRGNVNVKSMTLSPSSFAIQLPWMIDPEWTITNPGGYSSTFGDTSSIPQMEVDEQVDEHDDALFGEPRSGHWPTVRKAFVKLHPMCAACGSTNNLNVHHVVPFHERKELECDPNNLITLCRDCHFHIGHHDNWKNSNPKVREEAAEHLKSIK